MRGISQFTLAAVVIALSVLPALAQSAGSETIPPGAQNPALVQPQAVTPVRSVPQPGGARPAPQPLLAQPSQPGAQPGEAPLGPTPNQAAPSALISPDGAGGLCECLIGHDPARSVLDKSRMHQTCLASVDACQAACNTQRYFAFVPHAVYTCPGRSIDRNSIALSTSGAGRHRLAQR